MAKSNRKKSSKPTQLPAFDRRNPGTVTAVIETPGGSRNKFKYDESLGFYAPSGVLPEGMVFPHAFGFVPGTKAADGDPEDILIIMDEPTFSGCVVQTRLLGVLEAEQTEKGETERNDRLIAVAAESRDYSEAKSLKDLNSKHVEGDRAVFRHVQQRERQEIQSAQNERPETSTETGKEKFAVREVFPA